MADPPRWPGCAWSSSASCSPGPYVGTLLGDFGAEVDQGRGAAGSGDPMRDWGRLRHNDHSLWWSILARNKRSVSLNLRDERGQDARGAAVRDGRRRARELPARHDGEVGARPRGRPRAQPAARSTRACPATGRPGATATARASPRPARRSAGCATSTAIPTRRRRARGISLGDTLAAQSAFQGILLALYARDARGADGPGRRRLDHRRVLRDARVDGRGVREDAASCASRRGTRLPRIAPSNVYRSSDGSWVVIAANHDTLWKRLAKLMGRPELGRGRALRHPPRARRARGPARRDDRRVGRAAHGGRARPRSSTRRAWCARRSTRSPTSHADPYFRERGLLVEHRGRGARADARARRGAEADRDAGRDPQRRRAGRWAPTPRRCSASWAWRATSTARLPTTA